MPRACTCPNLRWDWIELVGHFSLRLHVSHCRCHEAAGFLHEYQWGFARFYCYFFFLSVALWHIIRSWGQGKERCVCSSNAHTKAQVIIIPLRESIRERYRDLSGVTDALLKEINLLAFSPFFCMSHRASKSLIRLTFKSVYCNCLLLFYLLSVIWSFPQLIQTSAYLKVFKRIIFPMSAQAMWEYSIWEYV